MTGRIRIIGGQWRGRKLNVPDLPGLRPTGDRARETVFNWLQPRIAGSRCLDLFAGTGVLGLEAASRGASAVVLVERDARLANALREVAGQWPGGGVLDIVHADAMVWMNRAEPDFDIVFVDPPYAEGLQQSVLERLVDQGLLRERALVYVEHHVDAPTMDGGEHFTVLRRKRQGRVVIALLRFGSNATL